MRALWDLSATHTHVLLEYVCPSNTDLIPGPLLNAPLMTSQSKQSFADLKHAHACAYMRVHLGPYGILHISFACLCMRENPSHTLACFTPLLH